MDAGASLSASATANGTSRERVEPGLLADVPLSLPGQIRFLHIQNLHAACLMRLDSADEPAARCPVLGSATNAARSARPILWCFPRDTWRSAHSGADLLPWSPALCNPGETLFSGRRQARRLRVEAGRCSGGFVSGCDGGEPAEAAQRSGHLVDASGGRSCIPGESAVSGETIAGVGLGRRVLCDESVPKIVLRGVQGRPSGQGTKCAGLTSDRKPSGHTGRHSLRPRCFHV